MSRDFYGMRQQWYLITTTQMPDFTRFGSVMDISKAVHHAALFF
jgi:hypothetical protein